MQIVVQLEFRALPYHFYALYVKGKIGEREKKKRGRFFMRIKNTVYFVTMLLSYVHDHSRRFRKRSRQKL